jgi:hypothetical protein
MSNFLYKNVPLNNILTTINSNSTFSGYNTNISGSSGFLSYTPQNSSYVNSEIEKPFPCGFSYLNNDISNLAKAYYVEYNAPTTVNLNNSLSYKPNYISLYSWAGAGGGGGGGGAGLGAGPTWYPGGGGGSGGLGGYCAVTQLNLSNTSNINITVGSGGNGGGGGAKASPNSFNAGSDGGGGNSGGATIISFDSSTIIDANGGGGGNGGKGGTSNNDGSGGNKGGTGTVTFNLTSSCKYYTTAAAANWPTENVTGGNGGNKGNSPTPAGGGGKGGDGYVRIYYLYQ